MTRCIQAFVRNGRYQLIPDTEVEDWDEVCDSSDQAPALIERVHGPAPYTHAFRLPSGAVYLVALVT